MSKTIDESQSLFCKAFRAVLAKMANNRGSTIEEAVADVIGESAELEWCIGAHAAEAAFLGADESYRVGRDYGVTRELAAKLWTETTEAAQAWLWGTR